MFEAGRASGAAVGLIIGLILAVILLKFSNTNRKFKTEYDERQREVRGTAYMYGFYATVIYEAALLLFSFTEIELPVENYILHFGAIAIGCTVLCVYSIWKGAYWGLNNDHRRYKAVIAVCIVLNMLPLIGLLRGESLMENGKIGLPMLNIMVLIMLAAAGVTYLIRQAVDRKEAEEE
ncbi:MAG: hypothetical protein J6M46_01390 [Lachnospiraceae bacterium]|nr:hypothetical protein [Lachnospiraceae bacterium]